jgi:hypothetical protein
MGKWANCPFASALVDTCIVQGNDSNLNSWNETQLINHQNLDGTSTNIIDFQGLRNSLQYKINLIQILQ